jgi:nitrogen fixation/metabolism regulation signal transduction histidine kinase
VEHISQFSEIFKKKIFRNIFFSFAGSLVFLILLYGAFTFPMQKQSLMEVMHSEAHTLANSISLVCADAMVNEDDSFIVEHNMAVINDAPNIFTITVSKRDGIILESKKKLWSMPETLNPVLKTFEKKEEIYKIIYSEAQKQELFHYTMPIVISGIEWGWIHVDFSLSKYNQNMRNMYLFLLYLTIGSMLIALLVSYFLAKYILTPILELTHIAKVVSSGNLSVQVAIKREDEIGDFAEDFNIMIQNLAISKEELKRSHDELENRVEERTYALAEKSYELEELNRNLDIRVQQESEKSRKNEQLLIQQSRQAAMGEMIGNIAHQWRQPLNALGLVLQNIHFTYQLDELTDEFMEQSVEKGKMLTLNMSKTIDDFRDFFKPNKLKETFSLASSIKNTIELIEASYKNSNIEILTNLEEKMEINGYPSEFSQVILNILSNAKDALIEYKAEKRVVKIESFSQDKHAIIIIEDNAGGIPVEILTKIFDPYFTTKEEGKGTGIGLYMTKTIVENNMGGKLSVQNTSQGAKFTISLAL